MKRLLILLLLAGCSKTPSFSAQHDVVQVAAMPVGSAPIVTPPAVVPAPPPPRADCAAPSKLVKIGTLPARASFSGELLGTGDRKMFDPETLASVPAPPVDTKIERRGGASITPSRYRDITNGRGLTSESGPDTADEDVVVDLASGRKLLETDTCMHWRFADGWLSTTGRFFFCHGETGTLQAWDLDAEHVAADHPWILDDGVLFALDDTYAVAAPQATWIDGDAPRAGITYFDVDTRKSKVVLAATIPIDPVSHAATSPEAPFDVQLCRDGDIFAATGDSEIAVFSGKDGGKLASLPSKEGGNISFSGTGKYLSQMRGNATTVYRLDL